MSIKSIKAPRAPKAKLRPTGYILYRGPSMLDGAPIVAVAITGKSKNAKTGNMVQTYILVDNGASPIANSANLLDVSICGNCIHRRGLGGSCYVNLGQGAHSVASGVNRGIYPDWSHAPASLSILGAGRMVRLGTYGDPAAVPVHIWENLTRQAEGHTGYTHQWRNPEFSPLLDLCMASADSSADRTAAKAAGFRTFRVRTAAEPAELGEFACPASAEQGKRKTCAECGACDGGRGTRKADPVIVVHGSLAKRFRVSIAKSPVSE